MSTKQEVHYGFECRSLMRKTQQNSVLEVKSLRYIYTTLMHKNEENTPVARVLQIFFENIKPAND